LKQQIKI